MKTTGILTPSSLLATTLTLLATMMIGTVVAWDVTLYSDTECEGTPVYHLTGTGSDLRCNLVSARRQAAKFEDLGQCRVWVYRTLDNCTDGAAPVASYSRFNAGCVQMNLEWSYLDVNCP